MKVVELAKDKLVLDLGRHERGALLRILQLYPRVPPAHHRLSHKVLPQDESNQRLLDEAMAEQRAEHKRFLQAFITDPARMTRTEQGCRLTISPGDMEYLLQVLNDVRVGSWVLLGSPEGKVPIDSPEALAMELSGYLQSELLSAIDEAHPRAQ